MARPLSVAEAQARTLALAPGLGEEWVGLGEAFGRVLARPLDARADKPALPVSAMDGYACRAADTSDPARPLALVGEVPAGGRHAGRLEAGQTVRIFTGAPLPEGTDAILIQEDARAEGRSVYPLEAVTAGRFVRPAGLDFKAGDVILEPGRVLDPLALGLAGALGHVWLPVRRRPLVAFLGTGDELVRPGEPAAAHQTVSTNGIALSGLVRAWGGEPRDLGIAADRPDALEAALRGALDADLIVTSGGASVGDYDLVRQTAGGLGLELDFWKIAMRPGKPLIAGRVGGKAFIGLPGNPVSVAVCAIVFVRAVLRRSLGLDPALPWTRLPLARSLDAEGPREAYLRATYLDGAGGRMVDPAAQQDSSMLATLGRADALVRRDAGEAARSAGEEIPVLDLRAVLNPLA